MTITTVRIRRTYTQTVTDYVDVEVIHDGDEQAYSLKEKAKNLIEAQDDCGHDIEWNEEKCERESYPAERISAEIMVPHASEEVGIQPPSPAPLTSH